jgi:hypothetical protein
MTSIRVFAALRPALSAAAALAAIACGSEPAPAADAPPEGTPVAVAATPSVSVGVIEGDATQVFQRVIDPFLTARGLLVVPDAGTMTIRVFDPSGDFVIALGSEGEGPGQFSGLNGAWARGDTIEAFDFRPRRVTRFLPDGTIQTIVLNGGGRTDLALPGAAGDGWALLRIDAAGGGARDQMSVHRFDRAGEYVGEVAKMEGLLRQASSTGRISGPGPLSPRARYDLQDGTIYLGDTWEPTIRAFGPAGDSSSVRWDPGPAIDPNVALAAVIEAGVASAPPDQADAWRQDLEGYPLPDRVPVFSEFVVDERGFFWIRPFDPSRHGIGSYPFGRRQPSVLSSSLGGEWLIVSPDGATVGTVTVPLDLEVTQITEDAVVGIARDELGVERVRVHPLERR